jgi:hypothetical protein
MEDLISEHTSGFLDTELNLEVSTGLVFIRKRIRTNVFLPSGQDLIREAPYTRDLSFIACEELDKYPFQQLKKLFHDV